MRRGVLGETLENRLRPALDGEATRQRAGLREPSVHASEHDVEHVPDVRVRLARRAQSVLVGAHQLRDRKPRLAAAREKLGAGAEGPGDAGAALGPALVVALARDKTAADREPGLVGERRPVGVAGDEAEGVRVARRRRDDVEADRARRVEGDGLTSCERQSFRPARLVDEHVGGVGIDRLRREAA